MKFLLLWLMTVMAASQAAVVNVPARSSLSVGYVTTGDRLLYRTYVYQPAIINSIQYQDVTYRGNLTTRISAIQATEIGYTQYASAFVLAGGIGLNNVTIRVQSTRGYGYYYLVDVWGR